MTRTLSALVFAVILLLAASPIFTARAQTAADGDVVPYVNEEGVEIGAIAVTEIVDPATDLDPNGPAAVGSRYVLVTFTAEAIADVRFDLDPYQFLLQATDGTLWAHTSLQPIADAVIPFLTSQALAPGSRISGMLVFTLPEDADVARVLYQPAPIRYISLATVTDTPAPGLGESAEITDADGGTSLAAVTEIIDPFLDFDPNYAPEPGVRYVAAMLTVENTSDGRFTLASFPFAISDADGYVWASSWIPRPADLIVVPDLDGRQLAPGDRISGVVFFEVPEDAVVTSVLLRPSSNQMLPIADLAGDRPSGASAGATPAASDDD